MKAKIVSCITIGIVIAVSIATSLYIILSGMKNGGYNYVMIEFNPKVEFVTDRKDNIVGYKALNDNARIALAGVDLEGKNIDEAVYNLLEVGLQLDYLTVADEEYNVIKSTVVPGLTNALDVHVYKAIQKFLVDHEVMAVIVENGNDKEKIIEAKKLAVGVHKLQLINSVILSNPEKTKEELAKMSERDLIDMIMEQDDKYNLDYPTTADEISQKETTIAQNEVTYSAHMLSLSSTKRDFVQSLKELNQKEQTKYELNYSLLTED